MFKILRQAALLLLVALFVGNSTQAQSTQKPNVIFVLVDDMGYADLSCYGGKPGLTPNIDSLAKEGVRFTQFYVGSPICSPSRTAFMTGQSPARWRITSFLASRAENERRGMAQWLSPEAPSIARTLQQSGYITGHFGKWHLGGQRDVADAPLIKEYGFDESVTQFEGLGDRILPLLDPFDGTPPRKHALGSDKLGRGNIQWLDRSVITAEFVDRTIGFIQRAEKKKQPFYVNLWLDDVHSPFFPPKALRNDESKRELYLAVVRTMDQQLAKLLNYVRSSEVLRTNTIIVFASDNGPEQGAGSAEPFRGAKGMLYEGGIRDPLIVWAPGLMPKTSVGTVNDTSVVSALDFFPSIARITGAKVSAETAFDGEDLSATLLGRSNQQRTKPLLWSRPPDRAGHEDELFPDLAVREQNWKLLVMRDGSNPQLYDLSKDPGEANNLADKNPEQVKRLTAKVIEWWLTLPESKLPDVEAAIQGQKRNRRL